MCGMFNVLYGYLFFLNEAICELTDPLRVILDALPLSEQVGVNEFQRRRG